MLSRPIDLNLDYVEAAGRSRRRHQQLARDPLGTRLSLSSRLTLRTGSIRGSRGSPSGGLRLGKQSSGR
jgi:hypothetical protein